MCFNISTMRSPRPIRERFAEHIGDVKREDFARVASVIAELRARYMKVVLDAPSPENMDHLGEWAGRSTSTGWRTPKSCPGSPNCATPWNAAISASWIESGGARDRTAHSRNQLTRSRC